MLQLCFFVTLHITVHIFLLVSWLIAQKKNYLCDLLEDKFIAPEKAMEIYIYHLDGALCIK